MQDLSGINWERIAAVAASMFAFGLAFNGAYTTAYRRGETQGYVFVWVIVGVLVTLGGLALAVGLLPALVCLALFGASGLPMAYGEMQRTAAERQAEQRAKDQVRQRLSRLAGEDDEDAEAD